MLVSFILSKGADHMAVNYKKPVDDNVPWDQRLANYASNTDAGKSEYQRALEVYRGKSAAGDTEGANAAKTWSDQVNTAIGGIGNNIASNRTDQLNKTTDSIGQKVNSTPFEFKQTTAPFQYNADSDPAYQAALRQAQRNTQTAAGNTAAAMNSRGIMDSTITADRTGQQAQQEYGRVSDTILPQLMQQAYTKYQDQNNNDYRNQLANYQSGQDQLKNLTGYAGTLSNQNQQDFTNNLATNQDTRAQAAQDANFTGYYNDSNTAAVKKQMLANSAAYNSASPEEQQRLHAENLKLAASIGGSDTTGNGDYAFGPGQRTMQGQTLDNAKQVDQRNFQYQTVQDAVKNGMSQQQIDNSAKQFAQQMGYNYDRMNSSDQQAWAQIAISQQTADSNDAYKNAQSQSLMDKQGKLDDKAFATERDGMISQIRGGKVALPDAMKQVNEDEQLGVYTPELAEKLRSALRVLGGGQAIPGDPTSKGPQIDLSGYGSGGGASVTGNVFGK